METVWVVTQETWEGNEVIAVCKVREDAEALARKRNCYHGDRLWRPVSRTEETSVWKNGKDLVIVKQFALLE